MTGASEIDWATSENDPDPIVLCDEGTLHVPVASDRQAEFREYVAAHGL